MVTQSFLLSWNSILRDVRIRWKILIVLLISILMTVGLVARRSPLEIAVNYFLYDPLSYWYRMVEWTYGWASVVNHPLFGVGMNEWERPEGILPSIDSFYLAVAVQHGLPAALLLLLAFFSVFLAVALKKGLGNRLIQYRTGFLITMAAFFLVGWTVTFWDHAYVFFLFLLGSGLWLLDIKGEKAQ